MMTNRLNHSTFRSLPTFTLVHHAPDDERRREGEKVRACDVISMQQTEPCISTILMWWSRPGHRQTALSSSSLLCTHQGLCRDLQPTTVVREQQMGRICACQTYVDHFLPATGACGLTVKQRTMLSFIIFCSICLTMGCMPLSSPPSEALISLHQSRLAGARIHLRHHLS